nr:pentatricopeptide repeat-containing protein At1g66345, mitochondrial [Ipomoea batatas]GME18426.1 pentatricopeptide repeat-containing protein At1g66345, mitochondrial [Ipomoea batatas]
MATLSRAFLSVAGRSAAKASRLYARAPTEPPPLQIDDAIATAVYNSFLKPQTWESLAKQFNSVQFTHPLVNKILLNLKDTSNAKQALKFFHWSAKLGSFHHGVSTYCITVHILVKARLIKDAKALLESVLIKPSLGNSDVFAVLESLLQSYRITDSVPFVFDLFVQVCSKLRLVDSALHVCKLLDENGFLLSVVSYNTLLHVLQKSEKHGMVWDIYGDMIQRRINPNQTTVKIMVSALCKEGRLQWFVDVVGRIHGRRCEPGVVVNTCLIHGMIEDGRVENGLMLLKRMLQKNMIIDTVSYSLIVFGKVKMGDLDSAWKVYDEMVKRGFEGNAFVYDAFISAYCDEGRVEAAIELVQEMERMNMKPFLETFNSLIKGCSNAERLKEGLDFCEKMTQMGLVPKGFERLCENGNAKEGDEMLTVLLDKGFVPDDNTYSQLLAGYAKEGEIEAALKLYYEMEYRSISPNSSSFSWLIIGLCKHGRLSEADKYLGLMKAQCSTPSSDVYKQLISSHLEKGNLSRADQLYREMVVKD